MFKYKIAEEFLPLIREQVWETEHGVEVYSKLSAHEFWQYGYAVGNPKVVLDIACGLGRTSIYLNHILKDSSIQFVLADREGCTENTGAFDPAEDEYYNDLIQTGKFCELNGLTNVKLFNTERERWWHLPKVDLIISTIGVGFHTPIERYLWQLRERLNPNGRMIFGIRDGLYGPNYFSHLFSRVEWCQSTLVEPYPLEHWLVLYK